MTGSVIKGNSTLNEYFFGAENSNLLTVRKFIDFQQRLQSECIQLTYAGFSGQKTKKMLKRVVSKLNDTTRGVTLKEYQDFFQVVRSIHDIDTALKFYSIAGSSIDKGIMKHVAKTVANVELSEHVIDIIFNLFDEDGKWLI